jgi:serine/threonine-protein kinase
METGPSQPQQLGKYQLVATLGQGGMGTVYLALASGFAEFRKLLVVKELRQDLTRQPGFVNMFMDEAKLAARLSHPNVVQTFEASVVGDRYFLAMEYLDGQSLSALLDRLAQTNTKLSLWMHIQILCEALAGLHYAHELLDCDGTSLQVVHRDVSPQNVFVTYHGQVKVVDFGVAKVANASVKTAPGVFVGKFSYASPEQVMGSNVDARTDVFAAGVMLWQAIAGHPFSEQSPTPAACRARCEGLEPRIAEVVPDVDPELAHICDRALSVDPDRRYDSAQELRAHLQEYLQSSGVRVEASEIGELMCGMFDNERRALHAHIEQAMRHSGASQTTVDDLSIFQFTDKVPTAVADLSSLVDISIERDDQKIRQGYAHSKIRLVPTPTDQEPVMSTSVPHSRNRWLALAALSIGSLIGVLVAVFGHHSAPPLAAEQHAPLQEAPPTTPAVPTTSMLSATSAQPQPLKPEMILSSQNEVSNNALITGHVKPAPSLWQPSAAATSASSSSNSRSSRSHERSSSNNSSTSSARPAPSPRDLPEPAPSPRSQPDPAALTRPAQRPPEPAAVHHGFEEGADLPFQHRSLNVRIDRENPYQ